MKTIAILLARIIGLLFGILVTLMGVGFLQLGDPSPVLGWLFVVGGVVLVCYIAWPREQPKPARAHAARRFSYPQECRAAQEHRVVRITYQDKAGRRSERDIEVYRPRDDSYVYGFCRLRNEPRTFLVDGILDWEILDQTYEWNADVEEWFDREGRKSSDDREDWHDWLAAKTAAAQSPRGKTGPTKLYKLKP
ncbi:MAG: helix-turn-helix transcriptional regulator [Nitrospirales bacterium]